VFAGIVRCPCILLQFTIVPSQSYSLTIIPIVIAITSVPIAILILQLSTLQSYNLTIINLWLFTITMRCMSLPRYYIEKKLLLMLSTYSPSDCFLGVQRSILVGRLVRSIFRVFLDFANGSLYIHQPPYSTVH
jgi:uncharacterized membrane protein YhhN